MITSGMTEDEQITITFEIVGKNNFTRGYRTNRAAGRGRNLYAITFVVSSKMRIFLRTETDDHVPLNRPTEFATTNGKIAGCGD